jgi:hypothetical protein
MANYKKTILMMSEVIGRFQINRDLPIVGPGIGIKSYYLRKN